MTLSLKDMTHILQHERAFLRAIALNVRSLAAKLNLLLSLPFEVFCLSEVRASWSAKRAMSRVAGAASFTAVWSK